LPSHEPQAKASATSGNVAVAAEDRRGLRRWLRYGARAALAARRVSLDEEGMVVYKLRKPTSTGRTPLVMTPQQFIPGLPAPGGAGRPWSEATWSLPRREARGRLAAL